MIRYIRLKRALAILLLSYVFLGLLTLFHPQREIYPIYSWFFFALVPNETTEFDLIVHEFQSQRLDLPLAYRYMPMASSPQSIRAHEAIQKLGDAVFSGNILEENRWRTFFEHNFLPPPAQYELIWVSYHPIQRWKTGANESRLLRRYTSK